MSTSTSTTTIEQRVNSGTVRCPSPGRTAVGFPLRDRAPYGWASSGPNRVGRAADRAGVRYPIISAIVAMTLRSHPGKEDDQVGQAFEPDDPGLSGSKA